MENVHIARLFMDFCALLNRRVGRDGDVLGLGLGAGSLVFPLVGDVGHGLVGRLIAIFIVWSGVAERGKRGGREGLAGRGAFRRACACEAPATRPVRRA